MSKFAKTDKFGNSYKTVGCRENERGIVKGYVEINGSLFKLEAYRSQGDKFSHYIRVTKMNKRPQASNF